MFDANNISEISYVRYIDQAFNARRLPSKILQHQPDTKYIRKQKSGLTLWSKNISQDYS